MRGFLFLRLGAHAAGGAECCQYRRCHRGDELNNKLCCLFLGHNFNLLSLPTDYTDFTDFFPLINWIIEYINPYNP